MIKKFLLCLVVILFLTALAVGQKREEVLVAKVYKGSQGQTMPYRLFVPETYDSRRNIRWSFIFMAVVGAAMIIGSRLKEAMVTSSIC